VTATSAFSPDSDIDRIFGAVVRPQTYRNLLYLLISFPLGILYFVTMITGLSVGAGTAVILVGFLVLAVAFGLARLFGGLEREITKALLGATFETRPPMPRGVRAILTDGRSWSTVIYLLIRFPLGIASFVTSVIFLVSIPIMAAPLVYTFFPYSIFQIDGTMVTTSEEALLMSLIGCLLFLVCAHVINGIAAISRRLAMAML
jgi:hypothetical protein